MLYKIIPFCQVPVSPIESQALLKYKALYVDGPLRLNEFKNYNKLYQGTAWINCKTSASTGKVK